MLWYRLQSELFEAPDKGAKLAKDTGSDKRDQMMWTALALGSIVNHNLGRAETLAYLTTVKVILDRVLELDKANLPSRKDLAALPHIAYGMIYSVDGAQVGGDPAKAKAAFEAALKLTADKDHPDGKMLLARV